jgi:hypothetical protein
VTLHQCNPAATNPTGDLLNGVTDTLCWLIGLALLVPFVITCVSGCVRRRVSEVAGFCVNATQDAFYTGFGFPTAQDSKAVRRDLLGSPITFSGSPTS